MADDEKIHDHNGHEVVFTADVKATILFIAANDSPRDKRVMIFPLSELPKIQRRLAEIAAEVKGED